MALLVHAQHDQHRGLVLFATGFQIQTVGEQVRVMPTYGGK
jgi:hypothetical protein